MVEKIKNGMTELVFILDRSGSMAGFEEDTVGGFNATVAKQREKEGKVYVSTVLFDNENEVIHDRADIKTIKPMTCEDYTVGGCTALLDAIGDAIHHIGNVHKYARPEDVPEHTVFVITTDGMENASYRYSAEEIKRKIKRQTERYGWEFLFLAANIDVAETAESIGIRTVVEDQGYVFNGVETFRRFLDTVDRDIGVLADVGNIYQCGGEALDFIRAFAGRFVHAHIKDITLTDTDVFGNGILTTTDKYMNQVPIGQGIVPLRECIALLKESGFDGWYSIEYTAPRDDTDEIDKALQLVSDCLKEA